MIDKETNISKNMSKRMIRVENKLWKQLDKNQKKLLDK